METNAPDLARRYPMLQAGLDLLDQGFTVFDEALRLIAWNTPFLEMHGFPPELAEVGAPFERFVRYHAEHGEYGPGNLEQQIARRVAEAADIQARIVETRRPDGRLLRQRIEPLPHWGFVVFYSDITEQRFLADLTEHQNVQLEERVRRRTAQLENANANLRKTSVEKARIAAELSRNEARLRLINDTIPILIGYVDRNEIYQYANKGYSDWFGHPEGSVTGMSIPEVIGEEVYAQVRSSVKLALTGQQVTYEYQKTRAGKTFHARTTLVPEITAHGETLGFFVFSYDISEQKRMQAALIQAQKMEAIGQLTGGLAHDFNNLLTVIIGNLAALQDQRGDDQAVNEFVEPALQSARRGVQLIKRLLTFSRQQPLAPEAVDVSRLVSNLAKLMRRSLPESITVSTDLSGADIHALADPGQLESALLNFALNARDAMPEGGRLHIVARAAELKDEAPLFDVAPGRYALFEVSDNGCGMDAETAARACEPFFTTKRFGLGSGLGLSMAHGFARQSGGGIAIHSTPGFGTTILLVVPLTSPASEEPAETEPTALAHDGELALLVEDDAQVRQVVRQQLVDLGYPVIEAENAEQALAMIAQIPDIALLISDVLMPGALDGQQLAERVRAEHPQIRIVLMSGYAEDAGEPFPILRKPFVRKDLARAIQSTMEQDAA